MKPGERLGRCLFANRPCDRIIGRQADVVFIAAPSADEYHFEVEAAKRVVTSSAMQPDIAVHKQLLSEDIFCEKICTKVIESRFCIVFLNGGNPNVFYEYGIMRPLRKRVISLLRQDENPPFNVRHLDTINYPQARLEELLRDAVGAACAATAAPPRSARRRSPKRPVSPFATKVSKLLELTGVSGVPEPWISELVEGTAFRASVGSDGMYFVGIVEAEWDKDEVAADTLVVCRRLEREYSTRKGALRVKQERNWHKNKSEDQARVDLIEHVHFIYATPLDVAATTHADLSKTMKDDGMSYPLPTIGIWTPLAIKERMESLTRRPGV